MTIPRGKWLISKELLEEIYEDIQHNPDTAKLKIIDVLEGIKVKDKDKEEVESRGV